jgi:hypothetical protein
MVGSDIAFASQSQVSSAITGISITGNMRYVPALYDQPKPPLLRSPDDGLD